MIGSKVKSKARIGYESRIVINPKTSIEFKLILIELSSKYYFHCSKLDIIYNCDYNDSNKQLIKRKINNYLSEYNSNCLTHEEAIKETILIEEMLINFIIKMHENEE